jgi:hypothetical protein
MKKTNRLPREQVDGIDDARTTDDGLTGGSDVEGHVVGDTDFAPRLPGTGGDFRRPSGGGEVVDGSDVEGHVVGDTDFAPRLPGTGGDFRRPSGGGEIVDDVEGHAR